MTKFIEETKKKSVLLMEKSEELSQCMRRLEGSILASFSPSISEDLENGIPKERLSFALKGLQKKN